MAEYTNYEKFFRDFFMYSMITPNKLHQFDLSPFMLDAIRVLDWFSQAYLQFLRPTFIKIQYQELRSDEQLLKLTIPRCLNLIDNERYFYSFMLVVCYLRELVTFIKNSRVCYRFHFTVYKCFLAVYKRKLEHKFDAFGGLTGLHKWLLETKFAVLKSSDKNILKTLSGGDHHCELVLQLIRNCNDLQDQFFDLNDYERLLIIDDDNKKILSEFADDFGADPLQFKWPPCKDEVKATVTSFLESGNTYPPHYLPVPVSDNSSGRDEHELMCSDLSLYTSLRVADLGDSWNITFNVFREGMKFRMCSSCGMKCYLVSRKLFMKQVNSEILEEIAENEPSGCILSL